MQTLLITGASGFTGQHFLSMARQQGYKCITLIRDTEQIIGGVDYIVCDLLDFSGLCEKLQTLEINYVVHLAAISFVGHGSVANFYETNVIGTLNLLDALIKTQINIKKVIVASSGNIYGETHTPPIDETMLPAPVNDYACSKVAMEQATNLRQKDLPIIIVRPFNYTGLGQATHFVVPKIIQAFSGKAECLRLGNLDVARDFSDVRDICAAYVKLLQTDVASKTVNVCSGKAVELTEIINMVSQLSNHKLDVIVDPKFVRQNEIKSLYGTDSKLTHLIGEYRQFSFQSTLEWMYHFMIKTV